MRESRRLLELARKCFEDAADCDDPAQMWFYAGQGRLYREQAAEAEKAEMAGKTARDNNPG